MVTYSILLIICFPFIQEWIVIGQVDMEALVEKHLSTVHDWEKNFKALKIKGKEVERLPRYDTEVKVVLMYHSSSCHGIVWVLFI